jgi:hypothetical protein
MTKRILKLRNVVAIAICLVAITPLFASCENEELIKEKDLPETSRDFIKKHFPDIAISHIIKDKEGISVNYTVYLANGFDVDFEKKGDWDEVDGHINPIPQSILSLLPAGITDYLATNFSDNFVTEVNKEHYGYEIGLNNGLDLKFNSNGSFIGIDD